MRQGAVRLGALGSAGSVTRLRVTPESFGVGRLKMEFINMKFSTQDGPATTPFNR